MTASATVTIPLFRSAPWLEVIERNVTRLAGVARVIISDPTGADEAFLALQDRGFGASVEFAGARDLEPGWVAHCNDLAARARTPYVTWLSHDDEIEPAWVHASVAALDRDPTAVAAVGRVTGESPRAEFAQNPDYSSRSQRDRVAAGLRDLVQGRPDSLGLLFRSVQRRELAPLLLPTPNDAWADVPWALKMLSRGPVAFHDEPFFKRWPEGSASEVWGEPGARSRALVWALDEVGDAGLPLVLDAWDEENVQHRRHARALGQHAEHLERERAAIERSRSWRLLRALGRLKPASRRRRRD